MTTLRTMLGPAKRLVINILDRMGYELLPDPYAHRLARVLDVRGISTVIDGGANVGQFAANLRRAGFNGRIVSIEPQSNAFEQLKIASVKDGGWHAVNAALASENGQITLNIAGNSVSSSALPMHENHLAAAPESEYVGTESVRTVTIDDIVADRQISPESTLLKLDVQGFEKQALAGAKGTLRRFAGVHLELSFVPNYEGGWLVGDVTDFMCNYGFELWMLDPSMFSDLKTGRLLAADGLYVPIHSGT